MGSDFSYSPPIAPQEPLEEEIIRLTPVSGSTVAFNASNYDQTMLLSPAVNLDALTVTIPSDSLTRNGQVVPGGALNVGDVFRIKARGLFSTNGISAATFQFRVKIGTVAVALTAGGITTGLGISSQGWDLESEIVVTAIGASGSVEASGKVFMSTSLLGNAVTVIASGATTVDTTGDAQVQLSVQPSISLASNSVTMRHFTVERLRA